MVYAKFTHTYDEVTTNKVTQWDYGRTLRIEGLKLPSVVRIDFCISGEQNTIARIGTTKDNVTDVVIPDSLLEQAETIVAYVYLNDTTTGKTVKTINIPVVARPMPEEHDTPESKELFAEAIEVVNEIANRVEEDKSATKAYSDSAKESLESTIKASRGFASAIKGKATGNVIKVDDVSPVEHDLKVKVDGATKVSRYGKNLLNGAFSAANNYLECTRKDGVYTIKGNVGSTAMMWDTGQLMFPEALKEVIAEKGIELKANTTYAISYDYLLVEQGVYDNKIKAIIYDENLTVNDNRDIEGKVGEKVKVSYLYTPKKDEKLCLTFRVSNNYVTISNVQIEIGTTTEYEPYKEPQTAEVVDGTVTGLISVSPNMTLIADNGTIEVEYNIDTKTYIDRKIAELVME